MFLILGLIFSPGISSAQETSHSCSKVGYTVLTINGVFVDEDDAKENKRTLERFVDKNLNGERVKIDYLHNESHLAGAGDVIKAIKQKVEGGTAANDYDLVEMLRDASAKVMTRKLLLVAHSQGNFYANSFYDKVAGKDGGVPAESIGVYSVATPSGRVAGGGRYLTSESDRVIAGLVGSMPLYRIMPPNTAIELQDGDDALGHNFANVYLKYKGAEIVSDIGESLDKLTTSNIQLETSPCIDPPKLSLAHKIEGAVFAVADPAAEGALIAGAGAVKGINAIGLAIGKVSQYLAHAFSSSVVAVFPANAAAQAGAAVFSQLTVDEQQLITDEEEKPDSSVAADGNDSDGKDISLSQARVGPARVATAPVRQVKKEDKRPILQPVPQSKEEGPDSFAAANGSSGGGGGNSATESPATAGQAKTNPPSSQTGGERAPDSSAAANGNGNGNGNGTQTSTGGESGQAKATPQTDSSGRALSPSSAAASPTNTSAGTTRRTSSRVTDTTAPDAPSVASPANGASFATTTVTFSGTAEADSVISSDFSSATVTATGGAWSLLFTLSQGTTTVQFYATDAAGNRSTAGTVAAFVDSVAPTASLASASCDSTLSSSACLVATTTLAFSWSSSASDVAYYRIDKNGTYSTTTSASISLSASDDGVYTFKVAAVDRAGNISATSTEQVEVYTRPLVVNEIAWAGTNANFSHEWLELYNRTSRAISLSGFTLYASDLSPYLPLSGTIGAGSYFLIESAESAVSNVSADLVSSLSLNNNGESLSLALFQSGATTTIDSVATCSGGGTSWCAGDDVFFKTMERYDAGVAGSDSSNWYSYPGNIRSGKDADNSNLNGTARAKNAISYYIAPSGSLSASKTLTAANSPYLVAGSGANGLTVASGATLTLQAGTVVKITSGNEPWIRVAGTIVANGTVASPVVFTAFTDDEYGGDMNGDGSATTPVAGHWRRLLVDTTSVSSSFTNTFVRYGGNANDIDPVAKKGAIGVDSATVAFDGLIVEKSNYHGLALENSNSTVSNSRFSTSTNSTASAAGLYISGGSPSVASSTFSGNYRGLYSTGATPTVTGNSFVSNTQEAVLSSGLLGSFSGNSGSGNGKNAILVASETITSANATTTLAANDLPYLVQGTATLAANSTLAFSAGVVVKGWDSGSGLISVPSGATLYSSGTTASNLVFTSRRDSSVGGTVSSGLSAAAAGDWKGIKVAAGGRVNLSGFTLRYAGASATLGAPADSIYEGALKMTGNTATSSGSIAHALFEYNYQSGLNLDSVSSLFVSDTTFQNHTEENSGAASAVYSLSSTATFSNITFSGNQRDGTGSGTNALTCSSCTPSSLNTSPAGLFSP